MPRNRPHILMLVSDEHSPHYTSLENHPLVRTPNLQRMHDEGVNLANGYCNNPICVPSRVSQITGQYPRNNGVVDWFMDVRPDTVTLPGHFADQGYETVAYGKMHFHVDNLKGWERRPRGDIHDPETQRPVGGQVWYEDVVGDWPRPKEGPWWNVTGSLRQAGPGYSPAVHRTELLFDDGIQLLRERFAGGEPERPLFLCISVQTPHYPFICPQELYDYYRPRVSLPETNNPEGENLHPFYHDKIDGHHPEPVTDEQQLNAIAAYCGMVEHLDRQIGRALDTLEELGVAEDFVTLYWTDHGDMMGEHGQWWKRSFYEASARIPYLYYAPGRMPPGHTVHQNCSLVDIFPTLCELADLPVPENLDGRSMARLLRGEDDPDWPDLAFCENWQPWPGYEHVPAYMLKKGSLKLQQFGASRQKVLFDLEKDPGELRNVADDPAYAEARADLEAELSEIVEPAQMRASIP